MSATPLEHVPAALVPVLAGVRLVALDVDGVLTDGGIPYGMAEELQRFDVKDGAGLVWLIRHGVEVVWITGRGGEATGRRARELGAQLHEQVRDKEAKLAEVQAALGIPVAETVAMGDDLPDLALGRKAAALIAPADAVREVRERAQWVTTRPGGHGAVRELCEAILAARGAWQGLVDDAAG